MTTQSPTKAVLSQIPALDPAGLPRLAMAVKDAKATRELMFTLRHFHLGDPGARDRLEVPGLDFLPPLLDPYRDTSKLRYDYPLFLYPPAEGDGKQDYDGLICRLADWLSEIVTRIAPSRDGARILRDHLHWIEYHLRQVLRDYEGPTPAGPLLAAAGDALQAHLRLADADAQRLATDLERLGQEIEHGEIMGYGRYPSMHLLVHAVRSRVLPRRLAFMDEIEQSIRGLKSLLDVEWGKSDESIEPRQARDSVGPGGDRFDPLALSTVMDYSRGTHAMSPERRARIEQALEVLQGWRPDPVLVRFVHLGGIGGDWLTGKADLADITDSDPCARAMALFDEQAATLVEIFSAVRIARLEMDGIYDPALHDPWFANLDWEGFSQEELLLVPGVIALESADRVASAGMPSFSRLLSSGRPVQILIRVQPSNNPGPADDDEPFQHYRTELAYLGLSHRQAAVSQSSAARAPHLMGCFLSSLDATRTSLHVINTGLRCQDDSMLLNAWFIAGAAIEGRAQPFFRVNPLPGDSEPALIDFDGNPQPEVDWPVHPFEYLDGDGNRVSEDLAFTFADYCLLIGYLREHFRLIPPGCDSQSLVPMQAYLAMAPEQAHERVPFIWAVDGNGTLHRLVASRELAHACLDRLNFWRTLQAMAGVRNTHVEAAIERTRMAERAKAAEERDALVAEHLAEVERVRQQAANEAMGRLTDVLMDPDGPILGGPRREATSAPLPDPTPPPDPTASGSLTTATEPAEPDDALSFDDPWIDTPLCTSCNDCLKINPRLFIYTEEKQAMLGDLGSATYAQLVEAAELCPAKCIHPGKPGNPDEPGLDGLIERAAQFNR